MLFSILDQVRDPCAEGDSNESYGIRPQLTRTSSRCYSRFSNELRQETDILSIKSTHSKGLEQLQPLSLQSLDQYFNMFFLDLEKILDLNLDLDLGNSLSRIAPL
jgi:hypothetical protein